MVKFRLYALQAQLRFDNFTGDTFNGWISPAVNTISRTIEYHRCYIHSFQFYSYRGMKYFAIFRKYLYFLPRKGVRRLKECILIVDSVKSRNCKFNLVSSPIHLLLRWKYIRGDRLIEWDGEILITPKLLKFPLRERIIHRYIEINLSEVFANIVFHSTMLGGRGANLLFPVIHGTSFVRAEEGG